MALSLDERYLEGACGGCDGGCGGRATFDFDFELTTFLCFVTGILNLSQTLYLYETMEELITCLIF